MSQTQQDGLGTMAEESVAQPPSAVQGAAGDEAQPGAAGPQAELSRAGLAMEGAAFVPTSQAFTRDGQPVRRFLKDLIAVGTYRHPAGKWTLQVTPQRLDAWAASFQQMRANGVDVEVVVDHRRDADATLGYLVDVFRWGERLWGVHELVGEQAIALAGRVKNVSVLIEKDFIDGQGRKYGEAITHSSLVQRPIVPGQQGFLPIAASRDGAEDSPVLLLYQVAQNQVAQASRLCSEPTGETPVVRTEETPVVQTEVVDAELLDGLGEIAEGRLDALVAQGRLTPAAADRLKDLLIGRHGSRNAYALSRKVSGTAESIVRGVAAALEQNDPVELAERTGGQYVALQRLEPGAPADHNPQTTREMIEMAGQK